MTVKTVTRKAVDQISLGCALTCVTWKSIQTVTFINISLFEVRGQSSLHFRNPACLICFIFPLQVSHLLAALQQGSRGTQACINASSAVQGIVSDLDTTVMFAATGTLQPETEGDSFGDHRFVTAMSV